jgi:hypothetical protein
MVTKEYIAFEKETAKKLLDKIKKSKQQRESNAIVKKNREEQTSHLV